MKTKRLAVNGLLAAMCAVLGAFSLNLGNMKITIESLPVILAGLMFGPVSGLAVGAIGTLIYQLLLFGVTVTTPLWILPYAICGWGTGLYALRHGYRLSNKQVVLVSFVCGIMIFLLNTVSLYIDSKVYGYYSAVFIFGSLLPRLMVAVAKSFVFAALMPMLIKAAGKAVGDYGQKPAEKTEP